MTTTPNEFLQFAKEMGLGQIKSTSLTLSNNNNNNNNNGCTLTGLSVLNNLCHLIEDIHKLKAENERLRAHLDLINQAENFLLKTEENNKLINQKQRKKIIHSTVSIDDGEGDLYEEKSSTLSPSNSLKIKQADLSTQSLTNRERQGVDLINNHEDLSSISGIIDHEQSKLIDNNLGVSNLTNWNRVRHALRFSLRRKPNLQMSPILIHTERTIPVINILNDNDNDHIQDNINEKKKKKSLINIDNQRILTGEDTDQDDECIEYNRVQHKRQLYKNYPINSSNNERQDISTSILFNHSSTLDDDTLLSRKQSRIAHYRRKLRSKFNTVKKQFSDPNPSSSAHPLTRLHGSTFDDIGYGLNHALLTAKLAPAMTKSYQQKMREWQTMQKSNFLVNYRRQSITNKLELNNDSRKKSIISTINESSIEPKSLLIDKTNILSLSPILSSNQRSFLVNQWREIMSEEILLRHYNEYLQNKIQQLKQFEKDLKSLKTSIFCTNNNQDYLLKHRSLTNIEQYNNNNNSLKQNKQTNLSRRCHSFQSLITMPNSWILAVQSAAYSDILDGTSTKITEPMTIFNKNFFNQLNHFKEDRQHFEQDTIKDLQAMRNLTTNISHEENFNNKQSNQQQTRISLNRICLRKLSLISPNEIPQTIISNSMIPLQTTINKLDSSSHIDHLSTPTNSEPEQSSLLASSIGLNKRSKRSRFDFKKTLQRSKSICMTQFNSWLQRHRQQRHSSLPRRKSATDSKTTKEIISSACSTPKLLGSPRLARIHQRIFKQNLSSSSPLSPSLLETPQLIELPSLLLSSSSSSPPPSSQVFDDSDERFQKQEPQVRIYLPARTSSMIRHVRITEKNIMKDNNGKSSPILNRRNLSSAMKNNNNNN
ncbi:unnamed protein product [Rotaria sordida]|uniref:Uncharacterized protein n=1 Tax=Rotaria sordida TaxID=392033 RepID=A0A813Z228_9BILA|nr:unnamed protein product [Rotaria sordida]CAF1300524.1 unnamed protein product [Rotaria sordida]